MYVKADYGQPVIWEITQHIPTRIELHTPYI